MAKNTCRQKILAAIEVDAACILGPTSLGGGCGVWDFVVLIVFPHEVLIMFPMGSYVFSTCSQ
jgi:hypothetical protein